MNGFFVYLKKIPSIKSNSTEIPRAKFQAKPGAQTSWGRSSDLHAGLELDTLNSIGIENRVICRVIGLHYCPA